MENGLKEVFMILGVGGDVIGELFEELGKVEGILDVSVV